MTPCALGSCRSQDLHLRTESHSYLPELGKSEMEFIESKRPRLELLPDPLLRPSPLLAASQPGGSEDLSKVRPEPQPGAPGLVGGVRGAGMAGGTAWAKAGGVWVQGWEAGRRREEEAGEEAGEEADVVLGVIAWLERGSPPPHGCPGCRGHPLPPCPRGLCCHSPRGTDSHAELVGARACADQASGCSCGPTPPKLRPRSSRLSPQARLGTFRGGADCGPRGGVSASSPGASAGRPVPGAVVHGSAWAGAGTVAGGRAGPGAV